MSVIISTWRMSLEGVQKASLMNQSAQALVECVISEVEQNPTFISVGYGGLPNALGEVECDAGFMDGETMDVGAIAGVKKIAHPIQVAIDLSKQKVNCMRVGAGAEKYALEHHFEMKEMLTEHALKIYEEKKNQTELTPYQGHDTIGTIALDHQNHIAVGTSTSGLFMKEAGRVGDSPLVGSGFYANEYGGACATGLGEDLMKGCVSYHIVSLMKEGLSPQQACEKVVHELNEELMKKRGYVGDLSVIALNKKGEIGAASNIQSFSFVVGINQQVKVYRVFPQENGTCRFCEATQEWIDTHLVE